MNVLNQHAVVIYSFPRAGTKLLAQVLCDFGYHNYGEWYDVWASENVGNTTARLPIEKLRDVQRQQLQNYEKLQVNQLHQLVDRRRQWVDVHQQHNPAKWNITIWPNNLANFPLLLDLYQDCTWLCPTRDPWQQLISWFVSNINQNYDAQRQSHSVKVSQHRFNRALYQFRQAKLQQQWILQNLSSYEVPFAELIAGTYTGFGQPYTVNSIDEHADIESLVTNIDEVRSWWDQSGTP